MISAEDSPQTAPGEPTTLPQPLAGFKGTLLWAEKRGKAEWKGASPP